MLGEILDGLAGAVAGARLRQHQREVRRVIERPRRLGVGRRSALQPELRLREGDAVVVLDLVGELQRAARLRLRILGKRDRGRAVGNRRERPGGIVGDAAQRDGRVFRDGEAALLGSGRCAARALVLTALGEAGGRKVEARAGGANDQHAAGRDRNGARLAHLLAGAHARQDHRRLAGVGRRRHPGVDAEIGGLHRAPPIERRGHAAEPLAAGADAGGDRQDQDEGAQRVGIAQQQPRLRHPGLQAAGGGERAHHMGLPERERALVLGSGRHVVGDRGCGPVRQSAAQIEPAQRVPAARQGEARQRHGARQQQEPEQAHPDGAPERRQREPEAGP